MAHFECPIFKSSLKAWDIRESSLNMTSGGWRYWGGAPKIFRHPEGERRKNWGGLQKFKYFKPKRRGGLLKNWTTSKGATKISSFEFQYLHPPLLILNKLSLTVIPALMHVHVCPMTAYNYKRLSSPTFLSHPMNLDLTLLEHHLSQGILCPLESSGMKITIEHFIIGYIVYKLQK